YADRNGGPLEDGVCDPDNGKTLGCDTRTYIPDRKFSIVNYNPAFFIQDEWRLLGWLAIMPGIRFEFGRTVLNVGSGVRLTVRGRSADRCRSRHYQRSENDTFR